MLQQHALRTAINAPMQGSSADIIKQAMLDIQAWIDHENNGVKMIMQVHDELVFEVAEAQLATLQAGVKEAMEGAAKLDVPLVVDMGVGANWDEAH